MKICRYCTTLAIAVAIVLIGATGCGDGKSSNSNNNNAGPLCGDGIIETAEECDDGAANSDTEPDACRTDCSRPQCNDGVVDSGEDCDGTNLAGATCASVDPSFDPGALFCDDYCVFDTSQCPACGDSLCTVRFEDHSVCPEDCAVPVDVTAGINRTCALRSDGTLWCWGTSPDPEEHERSCSTLPVLIEDLADATAIDVRWRVAAVTSDGSAYGWLGDGINPVPGLSGLVDTTVGSYHRCFLGSSGAAWCWGMNYSGQLGDGSFDADLPEPSLVSLVDIVALGAGQNHTCALTGDGSVSCWGGNTVGELGNASGHETCTGWVDYDCSPIPVQVTGISDVIQVSVGLDHSCALQSDGSIWCWGDGQGVGIVLPTQDATTPVQIEGIADATHVASGDVHNCAVRSDGTVWCWGTNDDGQLGDGTQETSLVPVQVLGLTNVVRATAGSSHSCALRSDGTIWCWGANDYAQLGNGGDPPNCFRDPPDDPPPLSTTPVQVLGF